MPKDSDFPQVPVKIAHIAEPKRYPVEQVIGCYPIDLNNKQIKNPLWANGQPEKEITIPGNELYEKMLAAGWVASMIGWARDDGHVNFGQAPTVHHRLVAVMVKIKAN